MNTSSARWGSHWTGWPYSFFFPKWMSIGVYREQIKINKSHASCCGWLLFSSSSFIGCFGADHFWFWTKTNENQLFGFHHHPTHLPDIVSLTPVFLFLFYFFFLDGLHHICFEMRKPKTHRHPRTQKLSSSPIDNLTSLAFILLNRFFVFPIGCMDL